MTTYTIYTNPKTNINALQITINGVEIEGVSEKQVNYAIDLMLNRVKVEANNIMTRVYMTANQLGGLDKFVEQIAIQSKGAMSTIEQYVTFMVERKMSKALNETNAHTVIEMVK